MRRSILDEQRLRWAAKPQLRTIYADYYRQLVYSCKSGSTLEVGGGSGNLKAYAGDVISTDIVAAPWLDAIADAQALPFASSSLGNVVGVDVLHHIERPCRFLTEVQRVLQPGGRLVMLEPAITPLSWLFYRFLHPEPLMLSADPLGDGALDPGRPPFDANQAIPTLLFGRHRQRMERMFPLLRVVELRYLSLIAYPLSGGFRRWSLIPAAIVAPLLRLEQSLAPVLGRLMAFRLFVVMERLHSSPASDARGSTIA